MERVGRNTDVHVDAAWCYMSDTLPPVPDKSARVQRRVKPVSRVHDKFERLRSLRCFADVNEMLTTGWPLAEVAKYIQKTKHESTDIEELTLIYLLQAYRRSLPPTTLVARRLPHAFQKASQEVRDGLDVLAEMSKLYVIQMKRVEIDHSLEKKAGKLIPSVNQEIREARALLESLQKLKMDLGLDERHLGTIQLDTGATGEIVTRYGKSSVRRVLEDPQASRKVLSLAERFVQISQERAEMGEPIEDPDDDLAIDVEEIEDPEFALEVPPEDEAEDEDLLDEDDDVSNGEDP